MYSSFWLVYVPLCEYEREKKRGKAFRHFKLHVGLYINVEGFAGRGFFLVSSLTRTYRN